MSIEGNGSNGYGFTAATPDIDSAAFTIEFWLKPLRAPVFAGEGGSVLDGILGKWQSTNWRDGAWQMFDAQARNITYEQSTPGNYGAAISPVGSLINNVWHHFAWRHGAGGENGVFVDGGVNQYDGGVLDIPDKDSWPFWLFRAFSNQPGGSNGSYFNGRMGELRMWNEYRTEEQIRRYYRERISQNAANLAHYYPMWETTGMVITDLVAGLNFTINAGMSWSSDTPPFSVFGGIA